MNRLRAYPDLAVCTLIIMGALVGRFLALIGV
ncbi:hypothetical protein NSDW_33250 [Novosphingobium olei]|nr:hypothetical protein NSDW_33250 [Novosphingobium olei]